MVKLRVLFAYAAGVLVGASAQSKELLEVRFQTDRAGQVSINVYGPDGALARRLVASEKLPAGAHQFTWDGRAEDGSAVAPGEYSWRGIFHEGLGLKLRGWAAHEGNLPWPADDGATDWGGDAGVPS